MMYNINFFQECSEKIIFWKKIINEWKRVNGSSDNICLILYCCLGNLYPCVGIDFELFLLHFVKKFVSGLVKKLKLISSDKKKQIILTRSTIKKNIVHIHLSSEGKLINAQLLGNKKWSFFKQNSALDFT